MGRRDHGGAGLPGILPGHDCEPYVGADPDEPLIERLEPLLPQEPDQEIGVRELLMALEERSQLPRAVILDDVAALKPAVDRFLLNALSR
jgi:hypothetical protein